MSAEVQQFILSLEDLVLPENEFMLEGLLYQLTEPLEAVSNMIASRHVASPHQLTFPALIIFAP